MDAPIDAVGSDAGTDACVAETLCPSCGGMATYAMRGAVGSPPVQCPEGFVLERLGTRFGYPDIGFGFSYSCGVDRCDDFEPAIAFCCIPAPDGGPPDAGVPDEDAPR